MSTTPSLLSAYERIDNLEADLAKVIAAGDDCARLLDLSCELVERLDSENARLRKRLQELGVEW